MNPCLVRAVPQALNFPHTLVLACQALGLETSPPLVPGLLFFAPEQGRCLTNCINDKVAGEKKPSRI